MRDTRPIGIRLPNSLWDLVRSANPGKTFSEIVKGALEEKYSFVTFEEVKEEKEYLSVEEKVDKILQKRRMVD